jgi:hypothetical protein
MMMLFLFAAVYNGRHYQDNYHDKCTTLLFSYQLAETACVMDMVIAIAYWAATLHNTSMAMAMAHGYGSCATKGDAMTHEDDLLYINGVNAVSGRYAIDPVAAEQFVSVIRGETPPPADHFAELENKMFEEQKRKKGHLGLEPHLDARNLAQTGWGILFAYADREQVEAIKEALAPLLKLRREQAGQYYREFTGSDSYRAGETKEAFFQRHKVGAGFANPARNNMPYYLLIVADPVTIPYDFQYQLDVQYAVGRIHFDDLNQYDTYARSIVEAETGTPTLSPTAAFFGTKNQDDRATQLSADMLVTPLAQSIQQANSSEFQDAWQIDTYLAEQTYKSSLQQVLGGEKTPALLFTASHGMDFPSGHALQRYHQGALLCQDWPGPDEWEARKKTKDEILPQDYYFAGDDLTRSSRLWGTIAFFFACFGGGTPEMDEYFRRTNDDRKQVAPAPFISRLPQAMLGHPGGGALAVVGHVERAWGISFLLDDMRTSSIGTFDVALRQVMRGFPVGNAMESFNLRYAEIASDLLKVAEDVSFGKKIPSSQIASKWTARNDARGYAIIGDPAVRLSYATPPQQQPTAESTGSTADRPTADRLLARPTISTFQQTDADALQSVAQVPDAVTLSVSQSSGEGHAGQGGMGTVAGMIDAIRTDLNEATERLQSAESRLQQLEKAIQRLQ